MVPGEAGVHPVVRFSPAPGHRDASAVGSYLLGLQRSNVWAPGDLKAWDGDGGMWEAAMKHDET